MKKKEKKKQGQVMRNTYCQGIPVQSFQYFGESQGSCSSHDGLITLQKTATAAEHLSEYKLNDWNNLKNQTHMYFNLNAAIRLYMAGIEPRKEVESVGECIVIG